jgi:nucleoside phosphorylase
MVNPSAYTVGWICALPTESVAVQAFLDEEHPKLDHVLRNDSGGYTLGKIGKHNVVIAVLPRYGTSQAASVATDMQRSFPNVKFALMVGIGGGVPTNHDIRLGDVVVSSPCGGYGGIFQYDYGKAMQGKSFEEIAHHNQPPQFLQTAYNNLIAQYKLKGHQLQEAINIALKKNPNLKEYQRPDPGSDRLYQAEFVHPKDKDNESCAEACDLSKLKLRPERTGVQDPAIHYGLIASANQVMKDALIRDKLAEEKNVLCFEMEAAGLMNNIHCLVIRGICDYSDSHKNKGWQGYAAMTAAAYAKDLLDQIPPILVEVGRDAKHQEPKQSPAKIEKLLKPSDPSTNYKKALLKCHEGLGNWFLKGDAFEKWKTLQNSFLWLYGIPGCGKTFLSSTIIKNLEDTLPLKPVIYFYFDFKDTSKRTLDHMIRSLISQLSRKSIQTWRTLVSFYSFDNRLRSPESLSEVLLQMIEQAGEVWIILDALDEGSTSEGSTNKGSSRVGLLSWLRELLNSKKRNVHLLATSRREDDIESQVEKFAQKDMISIQSSVVAKDIQAYIHARLEKDEFQELRNKPEVRNEIKTRLIQKANGMQV